MIQVNDGIITDLLGVADSFTIANIPMWAKFNNYEIGTLVIFYNKVYKCIKANIASDTNTPPSVTPIGQDEVISNEWWEKYYPSYYVKLSNGLIIQWGVAFVGTQQRIVNQKITFSTPFKNKDYTLTVTPNTWQSDTIHRIGWIGSNKLSTTQAWVNFYGNGNQDTIDGMNWLAIGF